MSTSVNTRCCSLALLLYLAASLDLSAMSYNLYGWNAFGQNRWKASNILAKINHYAPDILGCQEVEGNAPWIIQETIDANKGAFSTTAPHAGHIIFYRASLFQVEDQGHFDISEQDQWGLRRLAWAVFRHTFSGQLFLHFNSHWCVCGELQLFATARSVAHWVKDVRDRFNGLPTMLTGDLNVFGGCHNSKAIRYLKGEIVDGHLSPVVFVDAHEGQGATFGDCKIDYMLLAGAWNAMRTKIDRDHRVANIGSDHDSLYASLRTGSAATTTAPLRRNLCEEGGAVWNSMAESHTCGSRIEWLMANQHQGNMRAAREQVAREYPNICGPCSHDTTSTSTTTRPVSTAPMTTTPAVVGLCEEGDSVWNTIAEGHTCGARIQWSSANQHQGNMRAAREQVAREHPSSCGACSHVTTTTVTTAMLVTTTTITTTSAVVACEEGSAVWNAIAEGHTCGARIQWSNANQHQGNLDAAKEQVSREYPRVCGGCKPARRLSAIVHGTSVVVHV